LRHWRRRQGRSVHSECVGWVIEPRNHELVGAETVGNVEGNTGKPLREAKLVRPGSKPPSRTHGTRRNLGDLISDRRHHAGPRAEGEEPKRKMNGDEKSDLAVVAMKLSNKAGPSSEALAKEGDPVAEAVEPRAGAKGKRKVNWILDADIRSFFDSVSQEWLTRFLEHRIGDKRIIRLMQKWLKAGVLEDGVVTVSETGTGQGSVISPLLANVYLHYVIDLWAERWRRREAAGDMIIVRYADDLVVGFEHEAEARRFLDAMRARLEEFALSLHPEKTRIIEFGPHADANRKQRGLGKPETFNFLGFTFICAKTRQGRFLVKRKSRRDRVRTKLKEVKETRRRRMHQPVPEVGKWLGQVVRGFMNYHAVPTNGAAIGTFRHRALKLWLRTLRRRGNRDKTLWQKIVKVANDYIPKARILHPWPEQRFAVKHPRWEPYAGKPHVRFCAGGAQQ
jgi:group II intron reverse transcriptase/maturase